MGELENVWHDMLKKAAWYVLGLVTKRAQERRAEGGKAQIAIDWGFAMHEMIDILETLPGLLRDLDSRCNPKLSPALADDLFLKPRDVVVHPMVGIMGTTDPRVEANWNAARLSEFFGGEHSLLTDNAFVEKQTRDKRKRQMESMEQLRSHWDRIDVAVFTCARFKENFGKAKAPLPKKLHDQMLRPPKAATEIAGMYFNAYGKAKNPKDYHRIGIQPKQLQDVAQRGGSIMIVGLQDFRLEPTLAALHSDPRIVSVLVTHRTFAWRLLEKYLQLITKSDTRNRARNKKEFPEHQ